MDILGSILKKMVKPPSMDAKEKLQIQKQREHEKKLKEEEQKRIEQFRRMVTDRVVKFLKEEENNEAVNDSGHGKRRVLTFEAMNKAQRALLHAICEKFTRNLDEGDNIEKELLLNQYNLKNFLSGHFSFGEEEVDRHIVCFNQPIPPESELSALRRGEVYDPFKIKENAEEDDEEGQRSGEKTNKRKRRNNYQQGDSSRPTAETEIFSTVANPSRSYGFVSIEQKKDRRTIEETLADIRAKKKMKLNEAAEND